MELLKFLTASHVARRVEELGRRIAAGSREAVYERLSDQVYAMSIAESRGYIRARAAIVVQRQMETVLATARPLPPAARSEVLSRSLSLIVDRLSDDVLRNRRLSRFPRRAA